MRDMKFRHEYKHYINFLDYITLKQRLKVIMKRDSHIGDDGSYKVRSLYFDNPDNKVLREKIEGINNREKFRIRYYNDNLSFIRLEKKTKVNGLCNKINVMLTNKECECLVDGKLNWMKDTNRGLVRELYEKMKVQQLRPKTVVDYTREAFTYKPGNIRVTLDKGIKTGIYSKDFLNKNMPTVGININNTILLEVKYDDYIPDIIKDIIQTNTRKSSAFSKYAVCRIYG